MEARDVQRLRAHLEEKIWPRSELEREENRTLRTNLSVCCHERNYELGLGGESEGLDTNSMGGGFIPSTKEYKSWPRKQAII